VGERGKERTTPLLLSISILYSGREEGRKKTLIRSLLSLVATIYREMGRGKGKKRERGKRG